VGPARGGLFHGLNQRLPRCHAPRRGHLPRLVRDDRRVLHARVSARASPRRARDAAGRADLVIAVSEFTKSQVVALARGGAR